MMFESGSNSPSAAELSSLAPLAMGPNVLPIQTNRITVDFRESSPAEILHTNLLAIFWLGDPDRLIDAIWHKMPVIYEDHGASAGRDAVLRAGESFRSIIGSARCAPSSPVIGHNGLYMLRWKADCEGKYVASGCHLANIRAGRIHSMYIVID